MSAPATSGQSWFVFEKKHSNNDSISVRVPDPGCTNGRVIADIVDEEFVWPICAALEMQAALKLCLPPNVCLTNRNVPDHWVVPLECTMGDLRQIAAALAKSEGKA